MQILKQVAIFTAMTCLLFVLAEGLSSTVIAIRQMLQTPGVTVNPYDESLGWVSMPGAFIPDIYGRGKYVRINKQGFRNDTETKAEVPDGKIRIICSGDSFTYGEGVANNQTWCHLLSGLNDNLDTVNLGQPGYGVDQMYLRYLRDGTDFDHSIHIFAFIGWDFHRMGSKYNHHYGKPVLNIKNDALVIENVPVPYFSPLISRSISKADFRSVDFAKRLIAKISHPEVDDVQTTIERVDPVASMVLRTIDRLDKSRNIVPVFVYLPGEGDFRYDRPHPWHEWTTAVMAKYDLPFIDLTPALQALPAGVASTFFIPPGEPGTEHYSVAGNKWVSEELYKNLMEMAQVRKLLSDTTIND